MAKRKSPRSAAVAVATRKPPKKRSRARRVAVTVLNLPPASSLYSVHPGVARLQRWIAELKPKTGCSLEQWIAHIQVRGPQDLDECSQWLEARHKLGTNLARWLAEKALMQKALTGPLGPSGDDAESYLAACPAYVDNMYAGTKAALRPVHDALIDLARQLGEDVRICPCRTNVPLYRRHLFAEVRPVTARRIDLGFALADEPFTTRLLGEADRPKKRRITHRVAIGSLADIDLQVKRWLKQAYELDG